MEMANVSGKKVTGQHVAVIVIALIAAYFGGAYMGWWGGSDSAPTGDNSEILEAIGGVNTNVSKIDEKATAALNTAKEALNTSRIANSTASSKATQVPVVSDTSNGLVAETASAVSSTNTLDDKAYSDAKVLLAKANRIASDAARFKDEARDIDSDEEDDASDLKEDIKDSKEDRDDLKEDITDLQDTVYQDWSGQSRNETAKDLAGQTLTEALDALSSAKEDYKDAMADVDDILEPKEDKGDEKVVYVQTPATPAVAGYQSQTEGL